MRVVVPHTRLHPVTRQVLDGYGLPVEYVPLEGDDSYRQLLQRLWCEEQDVVLVEHDVVPWPGAIEELFACPCRWGANSYRLSGGIGVFHHLGCTKLTGDLMRQLPGLWDAPRHWGELDRHLWFSARAIGQEPHPHRPPVIHLNHVHDAA